VVFADEEKKHLRSTPASGRGLSKKLRGNVTEQVSRLHSKKASPSRIFAQSMLTFDLHPGAQLGEDQLPPGESDLFVKFVTNRRKSDGRGSLRELINKRIALQSSGQILAQRRELNQKPAPPVEKPELKTVQKKTQKSDRSITSTSRVQRVSDMLEIPLGQDEDPSSSESPRTDMVDNVCLSQTQVWRGMEAVPSHTPDLIPPQYTSPHEVSEEPCESSQDKVAQESSSESSERSAEWPSTGSPRGRHRPQRNRFIDDEASQESDASQDDEEGSSDDADLSDLIASSSEDDDPSSHARLHMQWQQQVEDKYDPFKKGRDDIRPANDKENRRKNRLLATAAVTTGRKLDKNKPQKPMAAPPMAPPAWTLINKKRPGPKRNPHRRSSVSSCDGSIRIEIIRESKKSEIFSFITAPPKSALDKIQQRQELKTIAEETAAAPQRLQGSKRFVFGTNNSNT